MKPPGAAHCLWGAWILGFPAKTAKDNESSVPKGNHLTAWRAACLIIEFIMNFNCKYLFILSFSYRYIFVMYTSPLCLTVSYKQFCFSENFDHESTCYQSLFEERLFKLFICLCFLAIILSWFLFYLLY